LLQRTLFAISFIVAGIALSLASPQNVSAHTSVTVIPRHTITVQFSSCSSWYVVKVGDWLSKITSNWQEVARVNGLANPNLIYPGQRLCLSSSASVASPVSYSTPYLANHAAPGQCVWYVMERRPELRVLYGNAKDLIWAAQKAGLATGYAPRFNAVVVFQPGVQGANSVYGHVAIVEWINSNGSFSILEMNRYGVRALDGSASGLWKINRFTAWPGSGVSFIY
jgi:surface antigen